jgi:hypothetical protein
VRTADAGSIDAAEPARFPAAGRDYFYRLRGACADTTKSSKFFGAGPRAARQLEIQFLTRTAARFEEERYRRLRAESTIDQERKRDDPEIPASRNAARPRARLD